MYTFIHRLTAEESQSLQLNPQVTAENEEISAAIMFGELGINACIQKAQEIRRAFNDIVANIDPNKAIQSFLEVAANGFDIRPDGLGMLVIIF